MIINLEQEENEIVEKVAFDLKCSKAQAIKHIILSVKSTESNQ